MEITGIGRGHELDRDDRLDVVGHGQKAVGRVGRHGDVILLVRRRGDGVDHGRWAICLHSETRAAAVTCAIIRPELRPAFSARKGGRFENEESRSSEVLRSDIEPISTAAQGKMIRGKMQRVPHGSCRRRARRIHQG